jgi:hypothetical protein
MRLFLAVIVSSISILPLYFALLALSGDLDHRLLVPMLLAALAVATVAMCSIALPLHFVLTKLGRSSVGYYAIAGFLLPALVTLAINPFGTDVVSWIKWQAFAMGLLGTCLAAIFWWIARDKLSKANG